MRFYQFNHHPSQQKLTQALSVGEGVTSRKASKSIEELFGKRKNNAAKLAILQTKLPLSEVCSDETGVA
jgi:hypothetical protein